MSAAISPLGKVSEQLLQYTQAEAEEYAAHLSTWSMTEWPPDQESVSRILPAARRLRGVVQMARLDVLASLAAHVELIVVDLHSRRLQWSTELGRVLQGTIADLRELVAATMRWTREDTARAQKRIARLAPYTRVPEQSVPDIVLPVAALFAADGESHIISVPVTPQTEFERQLRGLRQGPFPRARHSAADRADSETTETHQPVVSSELKEPPPSPPPSPDELPPPEAPRAAPPPRGKELHAILQTSVTRLSGSFRSFASEEDVVPVETLLYSGPAALERARELARTVRDSGPAAPKELVAELLDMIEQAGSE